MQLRTKNQPRQRIHPVIKIRTRPHPITRLLGHLKTVLEWLPKLVAPSMLIGALMIHFYLDTIGMASVFAASLSSTVSFLALTLSFGLLVLTAWVSLIYAPLAINGMSIFLLRTTKIILRDIKLFWCFLLLFSAVCFFISFGPIPLVEETLVKIKIGQEHAFCIALFINAAIFSSFRSINTKHQLSKSFELFKSIKLIESFQALISLKGLTFAFGLFLALLIAQLFNFIPLLLFSSIVASSVKDGFWQWALFAVILLTYGGLAGLSIDLLKGTIGNPTQLKRNRIGVVVGWAFLVIGSLFIQPQVFIAGACRFVGVLEKDSAAQWYKVDKDAIAALEPRKASWTPHEHWESGYLYGFMIFQLGDVKVLCQPKTALNENAKKSCFVFRATDLRPIGNPEIWPKEKNVQHDK